MRRNLINPLALGLIIFSSPLQAANNQQFIINNSTSPYPLPSNGLCPAGSINVCGKSLPVPSSQLGLNFTMRVPSPYQHQPFSVQCMGMDVRGTPIYQIVNNAAISCALETCQPASVSICGVEIPIAATTNVGEEISTPIPQLLFGDTSPKNIKVQCIDNGTSGTYQLADNLGFSCNAIPCGYAKLQLCNSALFVPAGATLGTVLNMTMPSPFTPDPFKVQCLGSNGNAPSYQITDHSDVSCALLAQ